MKRGFNLHFNFHFSLMDNFRKIKCVNIIKEAKELTDKSGQLNQISNNLITRSMEFMKEMEEKEKHT